MRLREKKEWVKKKRATEGGVIGSVRSGTAQLVCTGTRVGIFDPLPLSVTLLDSARRNYSSPFSPWVVFSKMRWEGGWKRQSRWTNPEREARTRTRNKKTGSSVILWTLPILSDWPKTSKNLCLPTYWVVSERQTERQREEGDPQDTITGERFLCHLPPFFFSPVFWAALHGRNVEAAFSRQDACFWNRLNKSVHVCVSVRLHACVCAVC